MSLIPLSHDDLVDASVRWLQKSKRCTVVFAEIVTSAMMVPDAIGWRGGSCCILVECKVSRSDFRADAKKEHKRHNKTPGHFRWYMTPPGLLKPEEIPEGWGLMEQHDGKTVIVKEAVWMETCFSTERFILWSASRRLLGNEYTFDKKRCRFKHRGRR